MSRSKLVLYTKPNCPLCDEAKGVLLKVQQEIPFLLEERNIEADPAAWEAYREMVPVVELDGEMIFFGKVSRHRLRQILAARQGGRPALTPRYRAFLERMRTRLQGGHSEGAGGKDSHLDGPGWEQ
jgi:Glutaredoxin and related proteins